MNKTSFIDMIEFVENLLRKDIERANQLSKIFPSAFETNLLLNGKAIDGFISLLEKTFNDTEKWIDYFCFELDFGRKNFELKAHDENGVEIPLSNSSDLYNILTRK